jgi:uncharacterized cupin superfamily protein
MPDEARLDETEAGLAPAGEGWFVVNLGEAAWLRHESFGACTELEGATRFPQVGVGVHVLWPGQPNGLYHGEQGQEDFLVLSGECIVLIEGEERRLRAWDFVHCPPWTEHIMVGAGEGPCAILMVGARCPGRGFRYPASELALSYGAGAASEATEPKEAYAGFGRWRLERLEPDGLPWS